MAIELNGSGTITGISVGGLPDGCVNSDDIVSVVATKLTGTIADAQFPATLPAISGANLTGIAGGVTAWYARQSSAHNVAHNTYTKVVNLDLDTITQNAGSSYANSRFTVASGQEGNYFVYGGVGIDDIQRIDVVNVQIYKNGATLGLMHQERAHWQNGSTPNTIIGTGFFGHGIALAVGDYVELYVQHNEGSTEPTEEVRCWFGGFKM